MSTTGEHPTEALLDGRYHLGPCIGRGGTAIVYRAEDRHLGRTVAVKLLRQDAEGTASDTERAHREAGVLAGLNHPSLVTLYDARLDPGHPRYLAMEYVDGPTLSTRLTEGALSSADAAALAHDIARALEVVHGAGVIHRDVKPSNVLLAPPLQAGRPWTAKLTDFGIAHDVDDARSTSPGIIIGTAAYMAPEQVRAEELTPAVDIYSLALVLIEALTGTPAFPVSNGIQTALSRLTNEPAIPDSLGHGWRALLGRMTRTDPHARPSAGDVADAATVLMDRPVDEHEESGATREYPVAAPPAPRPQRHRRLRIAALAAAGAFVASAAALSWSMSMQPPAPERIAVTDTPTPQPTRSVPDDIAGGDDETVAPATTNGQQQGQTVGQGDAPNPNKGPGNNSGKSDQAPGNGNGKGKGK